MQLLLLRSYNSYSCEENIKETEQEIMSCNFLSAT